MRAVIYELPDDKLEIALISETAQEVALLAKFEKLGGTSREFWLHPNIGTNQACLKLAELL